MATNQKFLTSAQVTKCKKIVASETAMSSRAAALLAIHGGASQTEAASQTNLTVGQVRYWVAKFRHVAMAAFPEPVADAPVENDKPVTDKSKKKSKKIKPKDSGKKKTKAEKKKKKDKQDKKNKSEKKQKKKDKAKKKAKKK